MRPCAAFYILSLMTEYTLAPANFKDYRDFLKSRFELIQEKNKRFSLQACANQSKISKSLLQFLFQKKRHLSLDKIPVLARSLKLSADEESYVYLMLCYGSAKSPEVKTHFEQVMSRIRNQHIVASKLPLPLSAKNEKDLYLNSFYMILQKLIRLPDFREDPLWIFNNLKIPDLKLEQIEKVLQDLVDLGHAKRDASGRLTITEETLWRPDHYDPTGQKVFTRGAETAAHLMQTPNVYKPAVYMSMTLAFDEENLSRAEKFMIEVHHTLAALSKKSKEPTAVSFIGNFFLTVFRLKPNQ